ncbi:MAG: helix-turn-helix domain-containing protein [Arenicellales bacterium]|jgi:chromosome segregation and condensation protein ScpB
MSNTTTQASKVLNALQATDKGLTQAQMTARFGVKAPRAVVSNLRRQGFAIYANKNTDTAGRTKTFYRIGTPSRAVVAAGYAAIGA